MQKNINNQQCTDYTKSEITLLPGMPGDRDGAEQSYNTVIKRGYYKDEMYLTMSDETRIKHFTKEIFSKAKRSAETGAVIGGVAGTAAGIIAVFGMSSVIPGLGLAIAGPAGPIVAGLAGGVAGSFIGALAGFGVPSRA